MMMKIYVHDAINVYCVKAKKSIDRIEFSNGAVLYNKRSLPELAFASNPDSFYIGTIFNLKFNYHIEKENVENEFKRLKFIALNSEIKNHIPIEDFNEKKEFIDINNKALSYTNYCFENGDVKLYREYGLDSI